MLYPDSCVTGPERSVTQDAGAGETAAQQRAQQDWLGHLSTKNINHSKTSLSLLYNIHVTEQNICSTFVYFILNFLKTQGHLFIFWFIN